MRFWTVLHKAENWLAGAFSGLCLIAIILITVLSVIGRYFLQTDIIPGSYNIIERIVFPLLVFCAMPLAHRDGVFPRFELLADALPGKLRVLVGLIVIAVELAVYTVVFYYAAKFLVGSIEVGRMMQIGVNVVPLSPILAFIALAFGIIMLETLRLVGRDLALFLGRQS